MNVRASVRASVCVRAYVFVRLCVCARVCVRACLCVRKRVCAQPDAQRALMLGVRAALGRWVSESQPQVRGHTAFFEKGMGACWFIFWNRSISAAGSSGLLRLLRAVCAWRVDEGVAKRVTTRCKAHCATLQHVASRHAALQRVATRCAALQHVAARRAVLHRGRIRACPRYNTLRRVVSRCAALQHVAPRCNMSRRAATGRAARARAGDGAAAFVRCCA